MLPGKSSTRNLHVAYGPTADLVKISEVDGLLASAAGHPAALPALHTPKNEAPVQPQCTAAIASEADKSLSAQAPSIVPPLIQTLLPHGTLPQGPPTTPPLATPTPGAMGMALYVSPTGSDFNAGINPSAPLRTMAAAASRVVPGGSVNLAGGTYTEHLVTHVAGGPGQEITYQSYNGTAVLDGANGGDSLAGDPNQGLVELDHPYSHVKGIKLINSNDSGFVLNADHLTIEACEMAEIQRHGISTHSARQTGITGLAGTNIHDINLIGNNVHHCALASNGNGQAISLIADGFRVADNDVHDNTGSGIAIWLGAKHGEVVENTCHGNIGGSGLYLDGASYVQVDRNRIYGNKNGIGVSSEDPHYKSHHIWVYNNVVYDQENSGCFMWDSPTAPGFAGSQDVLFDHNTLVGNAAAFTFAGSENTAEVLNNLSVGNTGADSSTASTVHVHDNVWLPSVTGFLDPTGKDFRLVIGSLAIDKGVIDPTMVDDLGTHFTIDTDFAKATRTVGLASDAGAFELP
jgi:nitrous oxidase accessory protein NosD